MKALAKLPSGSAMVELVITLPIFVMALFFGLYLNDLVHAKLKIQEASRYAAFEMTSYALTDYASGRHDEAFARAAAKTREDVATRYVGLDSANADRIASSQDRYANLRVQLTNTAVAVSEPPPGPEEGAARDVAGAVQGLSGGMDRIIRHLGFNASGAVRAETSVTVRQRFYPGRLAGRGFFAFRLPDGLDGLMVRSRQMLIASGWHLPDGQDSVMRAHRAGVNRSDGRASLLYRQVSRMTFLGAPERLKGLPGASAALRLLGKAAPDPTGTYVVSHNYGSELGNETAAGCRYLERYPERARAGLNNLATASLVDHARPTCFDTAPFRDQARYEGSLYVRLFEARGSWFMGCKHSGADDPASPGDGSRGDRSPKVDCE